MNVANVATLDIPVATLIPLEQAFNHVSRFNILVYFLHFVLKPGPHSDSIQPMEGPQAELMGLVDIFYSPSFLINE